MGMIDAGSLAANTLRRADREGPPCTAEAPQMWPSPMRRRVCAGAVHRPGRTIASGIPLRIIRRPPRSPPLSCVLPWLNHGPSRQAGLVNETDPALVVSTRLNRPLASLDVSAAGFG